MLSEICQAQRKKIVRFHLYEVPNESENEVAQSCPTPWDPMDYSPPGSAVHGILQARILEWVAISLSRGIFPTQRWNLGLLHCGRLFTL